MKIGLDFDNTIARYDRAFLLEGVGFGYLPHEFIGTKEQIRDFIRELPSGEKKWIRLQGCVYGKGIEKAEMFEGLADFFIQCRLKDIEISIVSHKTEFGHLDPEKINLREAAKSWMESNKFFDQSVFGISSENIWFESTRQSKVARIDTLRLDVFIDDLPEVFEEPGFPTSIQRILFSPNQKSRELGYCVKSNWSDIASHLFGRDIANQ